MEKNSGNLRGMLFMLSAVATLSVLDVALKRLGESYPPMQVTFLRGIASLPLLLAVIGFLGRFQDLRTRRWSLHLLRSLLSGAAIIIASGLYVLHRETNRTTQKQPETAHTTS